MPKNPHADFSPVLDGYSGIGAFRFWCQTALPLTYDDSLSYYELLNKVVNYLNHTIEDLTAVESNTSALAEAYDKLQKYVNDYFDDLDVEAELRNVLDAMAEDGTLDALLDPLVENQLPGVVDEKIDAVVAEQIDGAVARQIDESVADQLPNVVETQLPDVVEEQIDAVVAEQIDDAVAGQIDESVADQLPPVVAEAIPSEVTDWLEDNVDPVGSAVMVDSSLTISGAAADAKVTGDELSDLKTQFEAVTEKSKNLMPTDGKTVSFSGITASYSAGIISVSGTATGDGGRLNKLTDLFTLPAGTYYATALNSTGQAEANVALQNSSNAVLVLLNNNRTTFTLDSSTQIFLGVSVTNGVVYNYTVNIQIETDEYTDWTAPSYRTAYDSIARGKVDSVYSVFGDFAKPTVTFTENQYINYSTGGTASLSGNSASSYIPVSAGENISISGYSSSAWSDVRGLAFYDHDKSFISGAQLSGAAVNLIVPSGAEYMRVTVESAYTGTFALNCSFGNMIAEVGSLISKGDGQSTSPSIATFAKVGFCGDSYVKGQIYNGSSAVGDFPEIAWGSVIGRLCGVDAEIYASSGADTNTWQSRTDCLPALLAAQNPCGLYIFCLGINDTTYVTLGDITDITSYSSYEDYPNTFYGNYGKIIEQVLAYSSNSRIILMTPFHPSYNARYVTPLTEISEHYGIAMIDTTKSSLCTTAFANALVGGHPTSVQHSQMADNIIALVAECISENADYFAEYHGV